MGTLFRNAILVQFDPPRVERGDLREESGRITAVGESLHPEPSDEVVDCQGCVLMPGLVNGHTHLYAALAVGMPAPPKTPASFHETLRFLWWRLDRAHTHDSVEWSGYLGAAAALRCGSTTLIDHHASPSCIEGSLDILERGVDRAGCRAVLCYETTDRNGADGAAEGLRENDRYLRVKRSSRDGRFAGMVGAHASFTLEEATLAACVELALEHGVGVHIHAAEDPIDAELTRSQFGCGLLERFQRVGLIDTVDSILAHCTHLSDREQAQLDKRDGQLHVAHAPRSNMNNAVGYTPIAKHRQPPLLGTDGIDGDLWAESKTAYFKSRDAGLPIPADWVLRLQGAAARRASASLGIQLGVLEVGAAADLVLTSYRPMTPMAADNLAGHVVFGMGSQYVRDVMVAGTWKLSDGLPVDVDEPEIQRRSAEVTTALHKRLANIPCD